MDSFVEPVTSVCFLYRLYILLANYNLPSNHDPLLTFLMELQFGHLQAHLSSWVPDRFRLIILISLIPGPHMLHDILFAKRRCLCSQVIVFFLASADESVNTYSARAERLILSSKQPSE